MRIVEPDVDGGRHTIARYVNFDGTVRSGSGFTLSRTAPGRYAIRFRADMWDDVLAIAAGGDGGGF